MNKTKIAISITKDMLKKMDEKIDGSVIRSRSQAIEFFLRKGLSGGINTAVIMLSKKHHKTALTKFKKSSLLMEQIAFFRKNGIMNIFILTQHGEDINLIKKECENSAEIFVTNAKKNGDAISQIRYHIKNDFIAISGDTYNNFDVNGMIKKHIVSDTLATVGLMSRGEPSKYGAAVMDGDLVIDFKEKPRNPSSFIVNSGVYIFKHEVFDIMHDSIEENVLPKLAKMKQLTGFFTSGEYVHFDEL